MPETACLQHFGGEERKFFLPMPRLMAAEREMDCSIFQLFDDIGQNTGSIGSEVVITGPSPARAKACHSVIRNALIGGGTSEQEAAGLIETYCYPTRPVMHDVKLTFDILSAAIYGVKMEGSKKNTLPDDGRENLNPSAKGK